MSRILKQLRAKKFDDDILDLIRRAQKRSWSYDYHLKRESQANQEPEILAEPLPPDAWQEFKRKFIQEYGGETVQEDGLTHREFLEYLRSSRRDYEWNDLDEE